MKRNEIIADIQLSFIELDTLLDCLLQELEDIKRKYRTRKRNARRKKAQKRLIESVGMCQKCMSIENLTIDHIIPVSKGGKKHNKNNWQVLCEKCNRYKADKIIKIRKRHHYSDAS